MSFARNYQLRPDGGQAPRVAVPVPPVVAEAALPQRAFCGGLGTPAGGGDHGEEAQGKGALMSDPSPPARAPEFHYPTTTEQGLNARERQQLGLLSSQAWQAAISADPEMLDVYKGAGMTKTAAAADWRHSQCKAATLNHPAGPVSGISEATRAHYKDLEAHFAMLAGQSPRDFRAAMQTGVDACGDLRADSKQAHFALKELDKEMKKARLHPNYLKAIASKKPGYPLLSAKQIWQLVFTIRNRITAKNGGGNVKNRNKSQREQSRGPQPEGDLF